ncbi:Putative phosphoribosyl transferase [Phycisphaerales bacterium]|nr:Putative phosphoribosyl transferase [Phycisphaerales bacterium]
MNATTRCMEVEVRANGVTLPGVLGMPARGREVHGVVVFAHGTGSGRRSPRNERVARDLNDAGLATLLLDLLTAEESRVRSNVFDIPFLARRLAGAVEWVKKNPKTAKLAIGLFGASTGAAAALEAAAEDLDVRAVVSRGGRPDLAMDLLAKVHAPTLLIVGEKDAEVMRLNRLAFEWLRCPTEIAVVSGAGHLFEEPGALEDVAVLASAWFLTHLPHPIDEGAQACLLTDMTPELDWLHI